MFKKQTQYSQFELFPLSAKGPSEVTRSGWEFKGLTLSVENIIVMGIIFVMSGVMFFSLGIEKGKRITKVSDVTPLLAEPQVENTVERPQLPEESEEAQTGALLANKQEINNDSKAQRVVSPDEPKADKEDSYTIQVASFKSDNYAQKEAGILKQKGFESTVHRKGNYSIVCVGNFIRLQTAKEFTQKLKPKYKDCLVRRL